MTITMTLNNLKKNCSCWTFDTNVTLTILGNVAYKLTVSIFYKI